MENKSSSKCDDLKGSSIILLVLLVAVGIWAALYILPTHLTTQRKLAAIENEVRTTAKYDIKDLKVEFDKGSPSSFRGVVYLQNGFGAWSRYTFMGFANEKDSGIEVSIHNLEKN